MHALVVIVHAHNRRVIEEPEVLAWQAGVRLAGEIEDEDVLASRHGVTVDGKLVAQVVRQRPAEDVDPADPAACGPEVPYAGEPGVITGNAEGA